MNSPEPAPADRIRLLRAHRTALSQNPIAYEADLDRLGGTLAPHLRRAGFRGAGTHVARPLAAEMVALLFEAQGRRPLFHVDSALPFCWNAPKDWSIAHIRYEWGHLRSRNQNEDAEEPENLVLCSARCNQHIQSSLDIHEVREWLHGSRLASRIDEVLARRAHLFSQPVWQDLKVRLAAVPARSGRRAQTA